MHSKPGAVAGAALLLMLLAACQPVPTGSPSVTVSPVATGPAPVCTATPGATPTPCTAEQQSAQQAEQQKQDALYREAERVYRAFVAEDVRLMRSGAKADDAVLTFLAEPEKGSYFSSVARSNELGIKVVGGDLRVALLRPAPDKTNAEYTIVLESCLDSSSMTGYQGSKSLGPGPILHGFTYFKTEQSGLKIAKRDDRKVASC